MKKFKRIFLPIVISILVTALIVLGYLYYQEIRSKNTSNTIDPLVSEIAKTMELPMETPQISTIENREQALLKDAYFFKNVKIGDKLIAYQYLLILYSPKDKKIVNVKTFTPPPPTPSVPLRISFRYNGASDKQASELKKQLEKVSPYYQIFEVVKSKAVYKNDVIYLLNPQRKDDIASFAKAIGDSPILEALEPNESIVDADLIVAFKAP